MLLSASIHVFFLLKKYAYTCWHKIHTHKWIDWILTPLIILGKVKITRRKKKKVLTCHSSQTSNKIKVEEAWRHLWLLYCSYALHFNHHCNCCYLVGRITNKACCLLLFVSCCVCSITLLDCLHSSLPSSPLQFIIQNLSPSLSFCFFAMFSI